MSYLNYRTNSYFIYLFSCWLNKKYTYKRYRIPNCKISAPLPSSLNGTPPAAAMFIHRSLRKCIYPLPVFVKWPYTRVVNFILILMERWARNKEMSNSSGLEYTFFGRNAVTHVPLEFTSPVTFDGSGLCMYLLFYLRL